MQIVWETNDFCVNRKLIDCVKCTKTLSKLFLSYLINLYNGFLVRDVSNIRYTNDTRLDGRFKEISDQFFAENVKKGLGINP